ncbi:MAG: type 1 glutamine amidotransferase family protein, partial [Mycobacteriales bacterium]
MTRLVLWDYGSGNLRSAQRALERVGAEVWVGADADLAASADGMVVPGVGAFAACLEGLAASGGDAVLRARVAGGRAVFGICVGLQMLFEWGDEHGLRT